MNKIDKYLAQLRSVLLRGAELMGLVLLVLILVYLLLGEASGLCDQRNDKYFLIYLCRHSTSYHRRGLGYWCSELPAQKIALWAKLSRGI